MFSSSAYLSVYHGQQYVGFLLRTAWRPTPSSVALCKQSRSMEKCRTQLNFRICHALASEPASYHVRWHSHEGGLRAVRVLTMSPGPALKAAAQSCMSFYCLCSMGQLPQADAKLVNDQARGHSTTWSRLRAENKSPSRPLAAGNQPSGLPAAMSRA